MENNIVYLLETLKYTPGRPAEDVLIGICTTMQKAKEMREEWLNCVSEDTNSKNIYDPSVWVTPIELNTRQYKIGE